MGMRYQNLYFILFRIPEIAKLKPIEKIKEEEGNEEKLLNVLNVLHPWKKFMDLSWLCEQPLWEFIEFSVRHIFLTGSQATLLQWQQKGNIICFTDYSPLTEVQTKY